MTKYSKDQSSAKQKLIYLCKENEKLCWIEPDKQIPAANPRHILVKDIRSIETKHLDSAGF